MNLIDQLHIENFQTKGDDFKAQMPLTDFHAQSMGFLNGGATLAFAEVIAGMASNQILGPDQFAVGQSITAQHLNPKKIQGFLLAKGHLLKKGGRTHVWEIKIFDEQDLLISELIVTNAVVKKSHL